MWTEDGALWSTRGELLSVLPTIAGVRWTWVGVTPRGDVVRTGWHRSRCGYDRVVLRQRSRRDRSVPGPGSAAGTGRGGAARPWGPTGPSPLLSYEPPTRVWNEETCATPHRDECHCMDPSPPETWAVTLLDGWGPDHGAPVRGWASRVGGGAGRRWVRGGGEGRRGGLWSSRWTGGWRTELLRVPKGWPHLALTADGRLVASAEAGSCTRLRGGKAASGGARGLLVLARPGRTLGPRGAQCRTPRGPGDGPESDRPCRVAAVDGRLGWRSRVAAVVPVHAQGAGTRGGVAVCDRQGSDERAARGWGPSRSSGGGGGPCAARWGG